MWHGIRILEIYIEIRDSSHTLLRFHRSYSSILCTNTKINICLENVSRSDLPNVCRIPKGQLKYTYYGDLHLNTTSTFFCAFVSSRRLFGFSQLFPNFCCITKEDHLFLIFVRQIVSPIELRNNF